MSIRVLHVLLEPRMGGPQLRILALAEGLRERGIDTTIVLPEGDAPFKPYLLERGFEVIQVPLHRARGVSSARVQLEIARKFPGDVKNLVRVFKARAPDVIHAHGLFQLQGALAARISGIPLVWHLNDLLLPRSLVRLSAPMVLSFSSAAVTVSSAVRRYMFGDQIDPRIVTIYDPPVRVGGSSLAHLGGPGLISGGSDMASGGSDMASGGSDMASGGSGMASGGSDMASGGSGMASGGSDMAFGGPGRVAGIPGDPGHGFGHRRPGNLQSGTGAELETMTGAVPGSASALPGLVVDGSERLPGEAPRVLSVGNLYQAKGHVDLVRAAALVSRPASFLIAGAPLATQPEVAAELERLRVELSLTRRVFLLGWRDAVAPLYAGCDLYVHPSRSEACPLAVLEAMAAGRAVVATDVGGVPELVVPGGLDRAMPGETGLLVPPENPRALAAAIEVLLADPARCEAMGRSGRARVEAHFSLDRCIDRHAALYRAVVEGREAAAAVGER
jgi:glycosyltransferase involved in cell wall biosynthesis